MLNIRELRFHAGNFWKNTKLFLRWGLISLLVGIFVGGMSTLLAFFLKHGTAFRTEHPQLIFLLPLAGVVIVFLYKTANYEDKGTDTILSTVHSEQNIPARVAPLIFVSTVLTHLFGGSAGRIGASLQLGGCMGQKLGRLLRLDENDQKVMVMCGMSAAFSAIFGTPMAAAIFSMEVISVGIMHYAALVPCVLSALVASQFAASLGIGPDTFQLIDVPPIQFIPGIKVVILAFLCACVSVLFCVVLHSVKDIYAKYIKNTYVRIIFSSILIILLTVILQTDDYMGTGVDIITKAVEGDVEPFAFLLKIIFTALTLKSGFKGGEIGPTLFIGATFGCLFGQVADISPSLCAALGMMALFCGVTNCPISAVLFSFELFGYEGVPYFLLAISVSYLMSAYYGLYDDQIIVYSKYKTEYINRKAGKSVEL